MDGGNQVYQECAPVWDGEDDLFDVASLDDLVLLPNLRRVLGSEFLSPELRNVLGARGIVADEPLRDGTLATQADAGESRMLQRASVG